MASMVFNPNGDPILEATDCFGAIVKFGKKNYDNHKEKHPELRQKQFCPGQIAMALKNPTLTIQGKHEGTLCHYLELFRFRGIIKYAKVVVQETDRLNKTDPHCTVKTAFKTDHIQELRYGFTPTYYNSN